MFITVRLHVLHFQLRLLGLIIQKFSILTLPCLPVTGSPLPTFLQLIELIAHL